MLRPAGWKSACICSNSSSSAFSLARSLAHDHNTAQTEHTREVLHWESPAVEEVGLASLTRWSDRKSYRQNNAVWQSETKNGTRYGLGVRKLQLQLQ